MAEKLWAKSGGVYFGYACDNTEGKPPAPDQRMLLPYVGDRHLITIGPNGSGKSRRLLLPNLERLLDWSMLVVDPKGELAAMTADHRFRNGKNRIVMLNPFDALGLGSNGFNPVAALDPESDDFADDALGLAEALIRVRGQDPHWSESAQDLVAALIMYSRLTRPDGGSLGHVRAELGKTASAFALVVEEMMVAGVDKDWEELTIKAARFRDISPDNKELNSVLSTALTQTRWLDSRAVKRDLAHGSFDFASLKEHPTTVYLILPARRLATHSTWLRLMIAAVIQPLMKDTRNGTVPVMLMLDEYFALAKGGFSVVEDNMAMFRGYGIKLWTVFQDLAQARKLYGDEWESFAANAGVLQSFAPQDVVSADYLSRRTGQSTRPQISYGMNRTPGGTAPASESMSVSHTGLPLMLPQDLRNMDDGFSVLFSHLTKGTVRTFLPYPTELPHMKSICALDPSAR